MGAATKVERTALQFLSGLTIGLMVCLLALVLLGYLYVRGMTTPLVNQSDGYLELGELSEPISLSGDFPANSSRLRYCYASVGLGGRLALYCFSAPREELHQHAQNEFASHWEEIEPMIDHEAAPPITADEIANYSEAFGVEANWMLPPADSTGALYHDRQGNSHRPMIYIDESNEVLYFYMTD